MSLGLLDPYLLSLIHRFSKFLNLGNQARQLTVPIIYMLQWCEYNYRHTLQLSKVLR